MTDPDDDSLPGPGGTIVKPFPNQLKELFLRALRKSVLKQKVGIFFLLQCIFDLSWTCTACHDMIRNMSVVPFHIRAHWVSRRAKWKDGNILLISYHSPPNISAVR